MMVCQMYRPVGRLDQPVVKSLDKSGSNMLDNENWNWKWKNQATSGVFGMPGEAVKLKAATHVLSPEEIAGILNLLVKGSFHA